MRKEREIVWEKELEKKEKSLKSGEEEKEDWKKKKEGKIVWEKEREKGKISG